MSEVTYRDVLLLAAETLEENPDRWVREYMLLDEEGFEWTDYPDACKACGVGIIGVAAHALGLVSVEGPWLVALRAAHDVALAELEARGWADQSQREQAAPLPAFNDLAARDAADVAALLRRAAA